MGIVDIIERYFYNFRINVYQSFSNTKLNVIFTLSDCENIRTGAPAACKNYALTYAFIIFIACCNHNLLAN
jgi:hypothetical protein